MGVSAREISARLGYPIFGRIPYGRDQMVDLAIQHSRPLVLERPNEVSSALVDMLTGFYRPIELVWKNQGGHAKQKVKLPFAKRGAEPKKAVAVDRR